MKSSTPLLQETDISRISHDLWMRKGAVQVENFNVLVVGQSTTGLINACMRKEALAHSRNEPELFTFHTASHSPMTLINASLHSRLNFAELVAKIKQFVEYQYLKPLEQHVHMVWYLIDVQSSRIQESDQAICQMLHDLELPVFIVLNGANVFWSQPKYEIDFREVIARWKFITPERVLNTIANDPMPTIKPNCCPSSSCKSLRMICNNTNLTWECVACGKKGHQLDYDTGVKRLVGESVQLRPELVTSFMTSELQRISLIDQAALSQLENISQIANDEMLKRISHMALLFGLNHLSRLILDTPDRFISATMDTLATLMFWYLEMRQYYLICMECVAHESEEMILADHFENLELNVLTINDLAAKLNQPGVTMEEVFKVLLDAQNHDILNITTPTDSASQQTSPTLSVSASDPAGFSRDGHFGTRGLNDRTPDIQSMTCHTPI